MPRINAARAVAKAASAVANLASPATVGRKRKSAASAGLANSARDTASDAPAVLPVPKRGRANSSKVAVSQTGVAENKPIGRANGNRAVEKVAESAAGAASAVSSAAAAQCLHDSAYAASHPMRKAELVTLAALGPGGLVCGVDEAGRGPLAGPVVAACCHVPLDVHIEGIRDSKDITDEDERERIFEQLTTHPRVRFAVHVNSHTRIDEINILQATLESMKHTIEHMPPDCRPSHVLIDGNRIPKELTVPATAVVKGDATVYCISAASVLAKVTRDRIMHDMHKQYPQYDFAQHKGYGVPAHMAALLKYGPCAIHRRTFAPVKHMVNKK